jgi:hypothetical protein
MFEIVENDQYKKEVAAICPNTKRWDDFMNSCIWQLSRNPRSGQRLEGDLWYIQTANDKLCGRVIVFYHFSEKDEKVYLDSLIKSHVKK